MVELESLPHLSGSKLMLFLPFHSLVPAVARGRDWTQSWVPWEARPRKGETGQRLGAPQWQSRWMEAKKHIQPRMATPPVRTVPRPPVLPDGGEREKTGPYVFISSLTPS